MKLRYSIRYFLLFVSVVSLIFFSACDESDTVTLEEQRERDDIIIRDFLENNNITNYQRTSSGLYHIPITLGNGESPGIADSVLVEYTGRFLNGKRFDSSRFTEEPFTFIVGTGNVISGWEEGIQLMRPGGTSRFIIPSHLAYGSSGRGSIPGDTVLEFDIELISFEPSELSSGN
mgnify:CR=1 FL=1